HKVKRTEDELWKVIEETIKMKLSGLRVKESSNVKEAKELIISMANENDQPTGEDDLTTKVDKLTKQLDTFIGWIQAQSSNQPKAREIPMKERYDDFVTNEEDDDTESAYIFKEPDHGSHHPFKVKAMIDISTKEKVIFAQLKLTSHALAWWNFMLKSLKLFPNKGIINYRGGNRTTTTTLVNDVVELESVQEADKSLSVMTKQKEKASNTKGQPDEKEELFTLNIQVKKEVIEVTVDAGSQKNLISASLVQKLGLTTTPHSSPYLSGWIQKDMDTQVNQESTDLVRFLLGVRNFFLVPYVQSKTRVSLVPGLTPRTSSGVRMSEGHWFSFENKSGGYAKKCFKEITLSLKGWKKKLFLIDKRVASEAMSWRHIDTDVRDDFLISYNEGDANHIAEHVILILITMEDFLNLHDWNRTLVSKGDPIPDNEYPLVRTTAPLPVGSVISGTISVAPINHSIPKPLNETDGYKGKKVETSIVNLSNHTRDPTPPLVDKTLEDQFIQENDQTRNADLLDENEVLRSLTNYEVVRRTYQSFRRSILSQAELLRRFEQLNRDHLDLYNRSEVHTNELNRLRSDFQMERWSNNGSSKKLVLLESTHAQSSDKERELSDRQKDMERESDELRKLLLTRMRVLEEGKARLVGQLAQSERARQGVIRDFISTVVGRLLTSVEYWKSLAIPIGLSFTAGWLGGLSLGQKEDEIVKISDSHHLSLEDLIKVSPGTPPTTTYDQAGSSVKNGVSGLAKLDSLNAHPAKTLIEPPLKTAA
nr:hypothetical protein [Tanacetum cinerariifolium]